MPAPASTRIEMPWTPEEGGRPLYIAGTVRLYGRWPTVQELRCVDQRTEEDVELPEWALDAAELALINEAKVLWAVPA